VTTTGPLTTTAGPVTTTTTVTVTASVGGPVGPGRQVALALDIGGTKVAAGVVDAAGVVLARDRRPMPSGHDAERTFAVVLECLRAALAVAGLGPDRCAGLGVGCGGPMVWPAGEVSPLNIPAWRGFPLRARLAEALGVPRVLLHNDAVALAVGEHWTGVGAGAANMLAVTVSTGVGGGLVLGGRLHHGRTGNAGHIGHLVVDPAGPPCVCGGTGCLEAIASGPRSVAWALEQGWSPAVAAQAGSAPGGSDPAGSDAGPPRPDGHALAADAQAGDEIARAALARSGAAVGTAVASCAALLDLDVTTVAGGFAQSGPVFWDALRAAFDAHAGMEFARSMPVRPSLAPADVALRGAAAFVLVPDRYGWDG
jgi:glucokinase